MPRSLSPVATSLTMAALAAAVVVGCGSDPASHHEGVAARGAASGPVNVEFRGCTTVLWELGDSPVTCVYTREKPLQLGVDHPDAKLARIVLDDRPTHPEPRMLESESGAGFKVVLTDAGVTTLRVEVPNGPRWTLRLREDTTLRQDLVHARSKFREAGRALQVRIRDGDRTALRPLGALLRNALSRGLLGDALSCALGASYFITTGLEDPVAALQLLDGFTKLTRGRHPHGFARHQVYRGRALRRLGRRLEATMAVRDGSRSAMRLDHERALLDGLTEYSMLLAHLGYSDAAIRWSDEALKLGERIDTTEPMLLLQTVATTHLRLERAGHASATPKKYYEQLVERSQPSGESPDGAVHTHSLLSLARIAMLRGQAQQALSFLRKLPRTKVPPRLQAYALDVELLALATVHAPPETLRPRLAELEALLARDPDIETKLRSTVRRAHVLEVLDDRAEAEQAYRDAELMLDLLLPLVALGIGGEGSSAQYSEGTNRYLSFLLEGPTPRHAEALCVARQAHARLTRMSLLTQRIDGESRVRIIRAADRYLESKDEYEDALREADTLPGDELERALQQTEWMSEQLQRQAQEILLDGDEHYARPSCDELSPREPGEVLLGLHPLENRLLVLVSGDTGDTHYEVDLPEFDDDGSLRSPQFASALLDPIDGQLQRARRIRVLASDTANAIPVHALDWNGKALGLQQSVVYSLELPPIEIDDDPTTPLSAVVHSDAEARTNGAAVAADDAARHLSESGFDVNRFDTESAQGADIRAALQGTDHFLYTGHAYFQSSNTSTPIDDLWPPYPGGSESEPSYLPLTEFARLEVADILMTQPAPRVAVLIGCATGVTDTRTLHGGKSLATAFLSAGSRVAIASTRSIESQQAWILSEALYEGLPEPLVDPGRWMQQALQAARSRGLDKKSIAYYRVFVP